MAGANPRMGVLREQFTGCPEERPDTVEPTGSMMNNRASHLSINEGIFTSIAETSSALTHKIFAVVNATKQRGKHRPVRTDPSAKHDPRSLVRATST
eukprot:756732-Hanusia_phi.AAC.12